MKKGLSRKK